MLPDPPAWMAEAICAQTDPEAWFPEAGGSSRTAKKVCEGCPVRRQCLAYALDNHESWGVWGGLTERERKQLARDRRAAA